MIKKSKTKGRYDPRNRLNNLTGSNWLSSSTTVWNSESDKCTLSLKDLKKLISLFSKEKTNISLINFKDINQKTVLGRKIINANDENKNIDYVLVNDPFKKINNVKTYEQNVEIIIDDIIQKTRKLKASKYITLFVQEQCVENIIPNITYHISKQFISSGFKFKGKINLIFKNGEYSYLMHFKKMPDINYEKHENNFLLNSKRNIPHKVKNGYGIMGSHVKLDDIGKQHPAPYSPEDIKKILERFSEKGDIVIDPFVGVGSTTIAAMSCDRKSIGIDLNKHYILLARQRAGLLKNNENHKLLTGDSLSTIRTIDSVDYCVTSPPYHNILRNNTKGVRNDKSQFRQGVQFYSEEKKDLGNQNNFSDFLLLHKNIMLEIFKKLKKNSYCSIVVSDFTINKIEQNITGIIIEDLEEIGFKYIGTTLLTQNNKAIYPFGYPYDYVVNHTNQYIVNFYKP
jgi:DNA modification methylase